MTKQTTVDAKALDPKDAAYKIVEAIEADCHKQKLFLGTVNAKAVIRDHIADYLTALSEQPAPDENFLTPEQEKAIVDDINSGRWPYLQPVEQPAPDHAGLVALEFVKQFGSGAQGCEMDCDAAKALADSIEALSRVQEAEPYCSFCDVHYSGMVCPSCRSDTHTATPSAPQQGDIPAVLKRGLDDLRAHASRGPVSSREIFQLTDPLMDILSRASPTASQGGADQ